VAGNRTGIEPQRFSPHLGTALPFFKYHLSSNNRISRLSRQVPFKHLTKSGLVTIAGKPSDDLAPGTLNSILKQAQLKEHKKAGEEE
jgi:hypothetical protein